jgi:ankyrin repeat protein
MITVFNLPNLERLLQSFVKLGVTSTNDALELAIATQNLNVVQALLDFDAKPTFDESVLKAVIWSKSIPILQLCRQYGLDINSHSSFLLRHDAASPGFMELLRYLIDEGADLNSRGEASPLTLAVRNGQTANVQVLLQAGADVHHDKDQAFRSSIERGARRITELLLNYGAYINANNNFAVRHVIRQGDLEYAEFLRTRGANLRALKDEAFREAAANGNLPAVEYLISHGADVHARQDEAIRKAAENNHLHVVTYLMAHGADDKVLR